jgi:hypothetical protein
MASGVQERANDTIGAIEGAMKSVLPLAFAIQHFAECLLWVIS